MEMPDPARTAPKVRTHRYAVDLEWLGNTGQGTASYRVYERRHEIRAEGRPPIPGSADPAFRGDAARYNPEELLVASLSACHMLWYLHLCAEAGVVVIDYRDRPEGVMEEQADGAGQFRAVILRPEVTLGPGSDPGRALGLHAAAHEKCFIARSVNFPVTVEAKTPGLAPGS